MKRKLLLVAVAFGLLVGFAVLAEAKIPYVSAWATALAAAEVVLGLGWLFLRAMRRFLWRVGRRLAFSYFLIGVLPIPLVALLLCVVLVVVSGFFLGSRYRAAVDRVEAELAAAATARLAAPSAAVRPPGTGDPISLTTYRAGRKVAGDERAPATWPAWLAAEGRKPGELAPLLETADGGLAFGAIAGDAQAGVLALTRGDPAGLVTDRCRVWTDFAPIDDPSSKSVRLTLGTRTYDLKSMREGKTAEQAAEQFFHWRPGDPWSRRPILNWGDLSARTLLLADGSASPRPRTAALRASPAGVKELILAGNAEVRTAIWAALITLAALLFDIYAIALAMALFMIFGLSRAVNRLYRATSAIAAGDFSVRIPVKRKDQVGDLQRSFNQMAGHLQDLVATEAQKEAIEKELEIARRVQKSLLPADSSSNAEGNGVEFSTHFSPSAAIGGDYFDVLPLADGRLAVVIADVSGHGLSAGLRMAMLKAGLQILVEQGRDPEEILRRLDRLVRSSGEARAFVTATLALLDPATGVLEIINAGHPPTYLVRGGAAEEIALPGAPLGGIGGRYGRAERQLRPGDIVVWLSDGLIEATDRQAEPFGYEKVQPALAPATSAQDARDRLLRAVAAHCAGQPAEDDQTLVVMRFRPDAAAAAAPARVASARG